ncbi:MAG: hypothetical protein ABW104_12585 [Candidatus Thiodiazotropha sp. 6PLUC2]
MGIKYSGSISIGSGSLYLCDMRYGPTEDGYVFDVDKADYLITHQEDNDSGLNAALIVKKGSNPDREERLPDLSTELNMLGVLDKVALLDEFGTMEELFEWGDLEIYLYAEQMFADILSPGGSQIHCFLVGDNEEDHAVSSLYQGDELVGFRVELNSSGDKTEIPQSSATIFKAELAYRGVSLDVYVFSEYDKESIDDAIRDCVLDHVLDDATRIQQIFEDEVSEIGEDTLLGDYDSSLDSLIGFKLYRQIGSGEEELIYDFEESNDLPENSIKGVRNAILARSK